jgi:hypothetical protein
MTEVSGKVTVSVPAKLVFKLDPDFTSVSYLGLKMKNIVL